MKKMSITLPLALMMLAVITASCSQNLVVQAPKPATGVWVGGGEPNEPISQSEVHIKAMRNFSKSYGDQQEATWYRSPRGFIASFENNGVKTMLYYSAKGLEESKVISYFEKDLPSTVRHTVKSHFYDYAILYVTEVQKNDASVFYVKMQDSNSIKTVKIAEGEWEIVEDLARLKNTTMR